MKMSWKIAFGLVVSASLIGAFCTGGAFGNEQMAQEASVIGLVIGALVGVVISVALLPTITSQVTTLENDTNLSDTESTLVGLWPLFIIIGISMYFVNMFI